MKTQERYIERNACIQIKRIWPRAQTIKLPELWPDRLILLGENRHVWIEFKTATGQLRPRQVAIIEILEALGEPVHVCRSTSEAVAVCRRFGPSPGESN